MKPSEGTPASFHRFLLRQHLVFASAESCTGGLVARQLTARAGSSEVFWGGVVSYSNAAKTRLLGVSESVLAQHGAVSAPVALAMVEGLLRNSGADLGVAITGVAGPSGGTADKPVGTVWFGVGAVRGDEKSVAVRHRFIGNRAEVQSQAAHWARVLSRVWWESQMTLDSLQSLTDNVGKPFVEASNPPLPLPSNPL